MLTHPPCLPEESYAAAISALNQAHYATETAFYSRPYLRECEQRMCAAMRSSRRILDVGCGAGRVLGGLPPGMQAVGVDINFAAVSVAKTSGNGRHVLNASMRALPFRDGSFDEVWCLRFSFNALPVESARFHALEEFWRVCAPGGRVVVELLNWHHGGRWGLLRAGNLLELAARRLQYLGSGRSPRLPDRDILYLANKVDHAAPGYAHLTHQEEVAALAARAGYGHDMLITSESSFLSPDPVPVARRFREYSMWLSATKVCATKV
jgi:SAM-dependent methyltransferase